MTDKERAKIFDEIAQFRAVNKGVYMSMEYMFDGADKTLDLIKRMYATNVEKAKEWHRLVLENDIKIMELTKKLCE